MTDEYIFAVNNGWIAYFASYHGERKVKQRVREDAAA